MVPTCLLPASWRGYLAVSLLAAAASLAMVARSHAAPPDAVAPALATAQVTSTSQQGLVSFDGVVQAVRQTVVAAQVPGAVVALNVRAGDVVRTGQVLLRLDARAAEQTAAAGAAQARAARASQEAATREFDRQKQLFEQNYISRAALDRAEAQHKAALAEVAAQLSSAGAARTQSEFHVIRAPYDAVVSEVSVVLGDMAMPGRALVTLHDPRHLRISAALPQSVAARLRADAVVLAEVGAGGGRIRPLKTQLLPTVDPATHTLELRLDLPAVTGIAPGMFARAWLPLDSGKDARLLVPARAVVRRAELAAVYVVDGNGRPLLRQVKVGPGDGSLVEILSGVSAGERVALDPQAAARIR